MLQSRRKDYACHSQSQQSSWSCTSLSPIIENMDVFTTRNCIRPALLHQDRITDEYSLDHHSLDQGSLDSLESEGSTDALLLPAQTVLPPCEDSLTNRQPPCGEQLDLHAAGHAVLKRVSSLPPVRRRRSSVLNVACDLFQNPLVSHLFLIFYFLSLGQ